MSDRTFATPEEIKSWKKSLADKAAALSSKGLIKKTLELAKLNPMLRSRGDEEWLEILELEMYRRIS